MFRLLFTVTLLGIGIPCFSEEMPQSVEEMNLHDESMALVYIGCGNANLLAHNFSLALEDFQRASSLLSKLETPMLEMAFLVSFGKAIASDNLGLKDQCQNAIGAMFFILNEGQTDEESDGYDSGISDAILPNECEEAADIMKQLATLAPSTSVREILLSIVQEMSQELLPLFKIADPVPLSQSDWKYNSENTDASNELCKSWWKKIEKFANKAYKTVLKAKEVWDFIKDIDKALKKDK